jgi:hypothetical protein
MRTGAIAVLLVVALVVGLGTGYFVGNTNERTTISTFTVSATTISTIMTTTAVPTLELLVQVEPTRLVSGQNVTIVAEVYNPLSIEVTANSSMIINPTQAPCGLGIAPTGIQIYGGHYTSANLTQGTPLMLYNASGPVPPCSAPYNSVYHFVPNSDKAVVFYLGTSTDWVANETTALREYWTQVTSNGLPRFAPHEFAIGEYTVLVFDAWGQQQLEYFTITT